MNKHIHVFGAAILAAAMAFCACSNSSDDTTAALLAAIAAGGSNGDSSTVTNSTGATTTTASTELTVTYGSNATCSALSSTTFTSTVYLDLTNSKYSSDNSTWNDISTSSGSPTTIATNVTAYNNSGYIKIDSSSITDPLKFVLTGTLSSGELFFKNGENGVVAIYMNNASITSGNYPCIEFKNTVTFYLHLTGTNSLTDGRTYGTNYSSTGSKKKRNRTRRGRP